MLVDANSRAKNARLDILPIRSPSQKDKDVYSPLNLDTTNLRNSTAQGGR